MEPFTDPPKKVIVIFRDFWLYCVVMGFSESVGVFPAGWYRSVQAVARKSPLLLSMGAGQFLDKELELNRPLRIESIGQVCVCVCVGGGVRQYVGIRKERKE